MIVSCSLIGLTKHGNYCTVNSEMKAKRQNKKVDKTETFQEDVPGWLVSNCRWYETSPVCLFFCRLERDLGRWKNPRRMPDRDRMILKYASSWLSYSPQFLKEMSPKPIFMFVCCVFHRKWSRRWPIGWWGSFGGLSSPPPCHRRSWVFTEAGRTRRSSLDRGWRKSYTLSGAHAVFKYVSHWLCALLTWLYTGILDFTPAVPFNDPTPLSLSVSPLSSRGCHEALSALEIPNDLLQVIQDLLLELRVHCLMVTLLHTTEGEGGLGEQEQ